MDGEATEAETDAAVAIEDRRFYHHGAIDPVGMGRAALDHDGVGAFSELDGRRDRQ